MLFSVSSSPTSALKDTIEVETGTSGFSSAPEESDTDEDGINNAFAPSSLFGTLDDTSDLAAGRSYKTGNDKPWALLIPSSFPHPVEQTNITDAYHNYLDWVASEGQTHTDWYPYDKINDQNQPYSDISKLIMLP